MKYLLDTCVLSELTKPQPAKAVMEWLGKQEESSLFLPSLTIGEINKGIEKLDESKRKVFLKNWLEHSVIARFNERVITLDTRVAMYWGELQANLIRAGKPMPVADSLIAATALYQGFTLVTRNTRDMEPSGVLLFNPWDEHA
ncbi:MAG: PIN domain-containing protein [Methylophilaceae bacterium]